MNWKGIVFGLCIVLPAWTLGFIMLWPLQEKAPLPNSASPAAEVKSSAIKAGEAELNFLANNIHSEDRTAVADNSELARLRDEVKQLTDRLEEVSRDNQSLAAALKAATEECSRLKQELGNSLVRDFAGMSEAKELSEAQRDAVANYIVRRTCVLPQPWQVKPLAEAVTKFDERKKDWQKLWADDPDGPRGNSDHPKAVALFRARAQIFSDWEHDVESVFSTEPELLAKLLSKKE